MGRTSFEVTGCDYCKVREKCALRVWVRYFSFFLTKYPMNNEYWLKDFFSQIGCSTQCAYMGNFWPCSAGGMTSQGAPGGNCAWVGAEQGTRGAACTDRQLCCVFWWGMFSMKLNPTLWNAQMLAGPEDIDIRVTSDVRIFPFYIQILLPPTLPAHVVGWG